ncbi:hypothetical protein GCM10023324_34140 [Streptomyces youssoufiensis]
MLSDELSNPATIPMGPDNASSPAIHRATVDPTPPGAAPHAALTCPDRRPPDAGRPRAGRMPAGGGREPRESGR